MLRLRSTERQCRLSQDGANPERGVIALRYAMSGTAWQGFIVDAISASKIGSTGYILPSRSNITIINNTSPIPPLG